MPKTIAITLLLLLTSALAAASATAAEAPTRDEYVDRAGEDLQARGGSDAAGDEGRARRRPRRTAPGRRGQVRQGDVDLRRHVQADRGRPAPAAPTSRS